MRSRLTAWPSIVAGWLLLMGGGVPASAAEPVEELRLLSEHAVQGMIGGNLSGLAQCGAALWAVSDRDDRVLYRLEPSAAAVWTAQPQAMLVPPAPPSGLSQGIRLLAQAAGYVRGGALDYEGISCDAKGNRYVVSEARAAVLKVPPQGPAQWLRIDPEVVRQARAQGLLAHFNAIYEGLAVDPSGSRLWLAAERQRRGIVRIDRRDDGSWGCAGPCVLLSQGGKVPLPDARQPGRSQYRDFADVSLHTGKLFTLERNAYRICRRDAASAKLERCWSFAAAALAPGRRYAQPYGLLEALAVDAEGAWLGVDNNERPREDGELRPIVWRFAAPAGGWDAAP
jgi:hypothetical protein